MQAPGLGGVGQAGDLGEPAGGERFVGEQQRRLERGRASASRAVRVGRPASAGRRAEPQRARRQRGVRRAGGERPAGGGAEHAAADGAHARRGRGSRSVRLPTPSGRGYSIAHPQPCPGRRARRQVIAVPEFWSDFLAAPVDLVAAGVVAAALLFGVHRRLGVLRHLGRAQGLRPHPGPPRPHPRRPVRLLQSLADGIKLIAKEDTRPGRRRPVPVPARPVPRVLRRVRRRSSPCRSATASSAAGPERRRVLHARGAVQRSVRRHPGRLRLRRASGRCSAASARRPRWSATKCRGRCACWCRSASPAR